VPHQREVTVNVCHYETQTRNATRTVCETVPETREVTVNVTTCQQVQRTGTRTVYQNVPTQEKRTVTYCEMVPYTTTETVSASYGSCCTGGCDSGCGAGCGGGCDGYSNCGGRGRRGLFRGRCSG
jgi:hypothetical protein